MNAADLPPGRRGLEHRLGAVIAAGLSQNALALPHEIHERLRFAREQARQRALQRREASAPVLLAAGHAGVLGHFAPWWQRAVSTLPLLALVAGLVLIDEWTTREQVLAAAEIDAKLLSDALPPAAYADPGFAEFLRSAPTP